MFSAFVDDSTIFLEEAGQLDMALGLLSRFGALSGLVVQPVKSKLIFSEHGVEDAGISGRTGPSKREHRTVLGL